MTDERVMEIEDGWMASGKGGFTDANGRPVRAGHQVEYEHGARRGIFLDATHDGDAYVRFDDVGKVEIVKWRSLCRLPAVSEDRAHE